MYFKLDPYNGLYMNDMITNYVCQKIQANLQNKESQYPSYLDPKPRGLGMADVESANCFLDCDLLFLLAVPGGA